MFFRIVKEKTKTIKYTVDISGIPVEVEKKKVKNLRLMVYPPYGQVKVSAPRHMTEEAIRSFISSKIDWINKHRSKYDGNEIYIPVKFICGEKLFYLGRPYILRVEEHNKYAKVELIENEIILYIKPGSTKLQRAKAIENWYRNRLNETAPDLIAKWESVIGVNITQFGIKKMKTRWGSCNIRAKRIWLNLDLIRKPAHCLELIIVHELVHLLEKNHNARFKSFMDKFLPDWRTYKKDLTGLPM